MALVSKTLAAGFTPNPYTLACKVGGNVAFGSYFARNAGDSDLLLTINNDMNGDLQLSVPGANGGGVLLVRRSGQSDLISIIDNLSTSVKMSGRWLTGQYQIFFLSKASTSSPRSGTFTFQRT